MKLTLHIASDHPSAPGHFPGNPIIPGAWLLAAVVREMAASCGRMERKVEVRSAKFHSPVRPGDTVEIEFENTVEHELRFSCYVSGVKVMSGVVHAAVGQ